MSDPDFGPTRPLAPPLDIAAVYALPDATVGDRVFAGAEPGFIYARDGHPGAERLAAQLAEAEQTAWGVVTGSGMAAVTAVMTCLLKQGDRALLSDRLYGKTTKLLRQEFRRFGVRSAVVDVTDLRAVEAAMAESPRVLLVETVSNPTLRIADTAALADLCRKNRCRLVADNTFATPALFRPAEHGADVVIESVTKMIAGHSDVTLGFVGGTDADFGQSVGQAVSTWGLAAAPFDCWLAERSLPTLDLRVRAAAENANRAAAWLTEVAGVERVHHPSLSGHPDRDLAGRLFPHGPGHVVTFEVAGGRGGVDAFMRKRPGLPYSPSLGHVTSTVSHPATSSHRANSPAERERQGITEGMIRLSTGVEPWERLRENLGTEC